MAKELKEERNQSSELPNDLPTITAEINTYKRIAGEAIFEIGRRLKHVKENDLAHGEFGKWLEEVDINSRQAQRFIKVYERFGKTTPGSHLPSSLRILEVLTFFTDEELEQEYEISSGEKKKPTEMSRREIEELRRQLKTETQAKKAAQERERIANEKAERLEQQKPEVRTEYKTEYVEVPPPDYEALKKENAEFRSKYGKGIRKTDTKKREELFAEFAEDLDYIRQKYGSIVFDSEKLQEYGATNRDYADKVNSFDDFWKQYVGAVLSGTQTIIDMEAN